MLMHALQAAIPPFLVMHGALDVLVPVEHARKFYEALGRAHARHVYLELPFSHHGFDMFHTPKTQQLNELVLDWFDAIGLA